MGHEGVAGVRDTETLAQSEAKLEGVMKLEPAVKRVVRASARLADLITDEDRAENMRVIRDAKKASTRHWDQGEKKWVIIPDNKTQLAATTLQLAYDEGTPVKRSITITSDFRSAEEIVRAINASPEASRAMAALSGLGLSLEAGGEVINTIPETVNIDQRATE